MTQRNFTRRFLLGSAAVLAGATLLPQGVLAAEPDEAAMTEEYTAKAHELLAAKGLDVVGEAQRPAVVEGGGIEGAHEGVGGLLSGVEGLAV